MFSLVVRVEEGDEIEKDKLEFDSVGVTKAWYVNVDGELDYWIIVEITLAAGIHADCIYVLYREDCYEAVAMNRESLVEHVRKELNPS